MKIIRSKSLYWLQQLRYKWTEGLDTKQITSSVNLSFKIQDLQVPTILDLDNRLHKEFVFDVVNDYETIIRQTKFESLSLEQQNLSFPKKFISKSLSFFLTYCDSGDYDIPKIMFWKCGTN